MEQQQLNSLTAHLFRENSGKMAAVLSRLFGLNKIDIIMDVVQDTFEAALSKWRFSGMSSNKGLTWSAKACGTGDLVDLFFTPNGVYAAGQGLFFFDLDLREFLGDPTNKQEISSLEGIKIYPNPTKDMLTLDVDEKYRGSRWIITDAHGKILSSGKLSDSSSLQIDVEQAETGVYFISIEGAQESVIKRWIKIQ